MLGGLTHSISIEIIIDTQGKCYILNGILNFGQGWINFFFIVYVGQCCQLMENMLFCGETFYDNLEEARRERNTMI